MDPLRKNYPPTDLEWIYPRRSKKGIGISTRSSKDALAIIGYRLPYRSLHYTFPYRASKLLVPKGRLETVEGASGDQIEHSQLGSIFQTSKFSTAS